MRVILTNLPPLLKDILSEALAVESDMAVVDGAPSADLVTLARQLSPDVVITQTSRDDAEDLARALQSRGLSVGLVAIDPDSRNAVVFGRDGTLAELSDVSPTMIITAIRSM